MKSAQPLAANVSARLGAITPSSTPTSQQKGQSHVVGNVTLQKRTDMYLSTLRSHIEAMGGELGIIAHFPDRTVKISNFAELGLTT
jgi:hypothetical protein